MPYVNIVHWKSRKVSFSDNFYKGLTIRTSKKGFDCPMCKKKYGSGTKFLAEGSGYCSRICLFCMPEYLKNSIELFNDIKIQMENNLKELDLNKEKWSRKAIAGTIKYRNLCKILES